MDFFCIQTTLIEIFVKFDKLEAEVLKIRKCLFKNCHIILLKDRFFKDCITVIEGKAVISVLLHASQGNNIGQYFVIGLMVPYPMYRARQIYQSKDGATLLKVEQSLEGVWESHGRGSSPASLFPSHSLHGKVHTSRCRPHSLR